MARSGRNTSAQARVFWFATALVALSAIALGGNRAPFWIALSAAALLLFAGQWILDQRTPDGRALAAPLWGAGLLYVGVLFWSAFQATTVAPLDWTAPEWAWVAAPPRISIDPTATWDGVLRLSGYAAVFWIAYRGAQRGVRARRFVEAVALWGAAVALFGIVAHFTGVNPVLGRFEAYQGLEATFVNPNAYAFYAGVGLTAALASVARRLSETGVDDSDQRQALRRAFDALDAGGWVFVLAAVISATAIALTASRGGSAAACLSALLFLMLYFRRRSTTSRAAVLALVAVTVGIAAIGVGGLAGRLSGTEFAEEGRFAVYPAMVDTALERPWTGFGLGTFADAFRPNVPFGHGVTEWDLAHNSYLENAIELGVIGAAALTIAVGLLIGECVRGALTRRRRLEVPCFAAAVGVAGAAHALIDFSLQMPATAALVALTLGVGCAQARSSPEQPSRTGSR